MRVAVCCCRLAVVHSCWLAAYKIGDEEEQRKSRGIAEEYRGRAGEQQHSIDELRKSRGRGRGIAEEEEDLTT
jgi:hypothetical protein